MVKKQWVANDGKCFDDEQDAVVYERNLLFEQEVKKSLIDYLFDGNLLETSSLVIVDKICENRDAVIRILKNTPPGLLRFDESVIKTGKTKSFDDCNKMDRRGTKVGKYTLDGAFIKEYKTLVKAGKDNHIDPSAISKVCRNELKAHGGFKWKYHSMPNLSNKTYRIGKYTMYGELIDTYKSIHIAAIKEECSIASIANVCHGRKESFRGFRWKKLSKN